ncbi:MAG: hypothetical protein ABIB71_09695 [Candidatus Woesearchaeota archaeon]
MKKVPFLAACILSLPFVLAARKGIVQTGLENAFDAAGSEIFIKIALWMVLFCAFYFGAMKAFQAEEERRIVIVISLIISFIAIRFMPVVWVNAFKTYLFIAALLLIPYFVASLICAPGWGRRLLYLLSVLGLLFLVSGAGYFGYSNKHFGGEALEYLLYLFNSQWLGRLPFHWWLVIFVVAFLLAVWLLGKLFGGRGGGAPAGPSGPGLFSRLGDWMGNRAERKHQNKIRDLEKNQMKEQTEAEKMRRNMEKKERQHNLNADKERHREEMNRLKQQRTQEEAARRGAEGRKRLAEESKKKIIQPQQGPIKTIPIEKSQLNIGGWRKATQGPLSKIRPVKKGWWPFRKKPQWEQHPPGREAWEKLGKKPSPAYTPMSHQLQAGPKVKRPGMFKRVFGSVDKAFREADKAGVQIAGKGPRPRGPMPQQRVPQPMPQKKPGILGKFFSSRPKPQMQPSPKGYSAPRAGTPKGYSEYQARQAAMQKPQVPPRPQGAFSVPQQMKPKGFWSYFGRKQAMEGARRPASPPEGYSSYSKRKQAMEGARKPAAPPQGFSSFFRRKQAMQESRKIPPQPKGYKPPIAGPPKKSFIRRMFSSSPPAGYSSPRAGTPKGYSEYQTRQAAMQKPRVPPRPQGAFSVPPQLKPRGFWSFLGRKQPMEKDRKKRWGR